MAVQSYSNKAKKIIRNEISACDWNAKKIRKQVDSLLDNRIGRPATSYQAGKTMVEGGCFGCYYSDTDDMLGRIYGKDKVKKWSNEKKWGTYTHLISREIDSIYKTGKMAVGSSRKKTK